MARTLLHSQDAPGHEQVGGHGGQLFPAHTSWLSREQFAAGGTGWWWRGGGRRAAQGRRAIYAKNGWIVVFSKRDAHSVQSSRGTNCTLKKRDADQNRGYKAFPTKLTETEAGRVCGEEQRGEVNEEQRGRKSLFYCLLSQNRPGQRGAAGGLIAS